jgi:hypothetical protein
MWGVFGQNDFVIESLPEREMLRSKAAKKLLADGREVERLRKKLGYTEPFQPYRRYLEYRQMRGSNAPGEAKLAQCFLRELGT